MRPVLVLDANQRSALAATRALGSQGIPVFAGDETRSTLAGSSKYCSGTFTYPPPSTHPEPFIAAVRREAADRGASMLLPMTDTTSSLLVQRREAFDGAAIPFGSSAAYDTLADKWALWRLARRLGVPVPRTVAADAVQSLPDDLSGLTFPLVVKSRRSRMWSDGRSVAGVVTYARSEVELRAILARSSCLGRHPFLLQEYIEGVGCGVFALYDRGKPVVFFTHRRLREKPPSGGVSVLSESVDVAPRLRELSERLLGHVAWHGVAMLEFRVSRDGTPYLLEANPRFWGSLQLAIDAGVNFPVLLYRLAVDLAPGPTTPYKVGVRSRWLLGDLDQLYLTLKGAPGPGLRRGGRWRAVAEFVRSFNRITRQDVMRLDDPKPFLVELRQYAARIGPRPRIWHEHRAAGL
jgi:predicted ATP-grasp superfamily ATP-dependent carboligase